MKFCWACKTRAAQSEGLCAHCAAFESLADIDFTDVFKEITDDIIERLQDGYKG